MFQALAQSTADDSAGSYDTVSKGLISQINAISLVDNEQHETFESLRGVGGAGGQPQKQIETCRRIINTTLTASQEVR